MKRGPEHRKENSIPPAKRKMTELPSVETVANDALNATPSVNVENSNGTLGLAAVGAGLGGLGWAGFSLGFGSAPLTATSLVLTPLATTGIVGLGVGATLGVGYGLKKTYDYFTKPTVNAPTQPKEIKDEKKTNKVIDAEKEETAARELQAKIGEEKHTKTFFSTVERLANKAQDDKQRGLIWHYGCKGLQKVQNNDNLRENADTKKHYIAKAEKSFKM